MDLNQFYNFFLKCLNELLQVELLQVIKLATKVKPCISDATWDIIQRRNALKAQPNTGGFLWPAYN